MLILQELHSWHFQKLVKLAPIEAQVKKGHQRKRSKTSIVTTDIIIKPVMQLQNLLPQYIKYRLLDDTRVFAMGVLPPEKSIPIHALNASSDSIIMQIFLSNYRWSEDIELKLQKDGMFHKELKPIDILLEGIEWNNEQNEAVKCPDLLLQYKMTIENDIFVYLRSIN